MGLFDVIIENESNGNAKRYVCWYFKMLRIIKVLEFRHYFSPGFIDMSVRVTRDHPVRIRSKKLEAQDEVYWCKRQHSRTEKGAVERETKLLYQPPMAF